MACGSPPRHDELVADDSRDLVLSRIDPHGSLPRFLCLKTELPPVFQILAPGGPGNRWVEENRANRGFTTLPTTEPLKAYVGCMQPSSRHSDRATDSRFPVRA